MTSPQNTENTPEEQATPLAPVPYLTFGLIALLVAIYLLTSYPGFDHIQRFAVALGGFVPKSIGAGITNTDYWRWVTGNLLHADPGHLLMNCFTLYIFGNLLEPAIGRGRFAGLILMGMLGCDISTWVFSHNISIGASGIAYSFIGFYFALLLTLTRKTAPQNFNQSLRTIIFVVLLYTYMDISRGGVNIAGHLGGFAGGALYELLLVSITAARVPKQPE